MEEHERKDDIMIKVLEERVNMWMETTTEYRKALCAKLDVVISKQNELNSRFDKLPCDSRKPMWEWAERNIYALWGAFGIIIVKVLVDWIKG